jgi:hypothetical protein
LAQCKRKLLFQDKFGELAPACAGIAGWQVGDDVTGSSFIARLDGEDGGLLTEIA